MWIEAALYTFRRPIEAYFDPEVCETQYRLFWDAIANTDVEALNEDYESINNQIIELLECSLFD